MTSSKRIELGMTNREQAELFQADTTWFHVFKDMIDNGDMAKLDGSAIKVYLVVKSYTNFTTGHAFPGIELVGEKAGLSRPQVMRCLKSLEEFGYITRSKVGRNNSYTLREKVMIKGADGRPQAVATWDYIPGKVKESMAEIKNAVMTGDMVDGKIIHIENLFLNVVTGEKSTQFNINSPEFAKLDPEMRELLLSVRNSIKK